ncbi:aminoglycoside phosphotransferase family protein [Immundisolibacter sp.]|uniref:aminoglycoside phosphotransferase family protein n=1 Tax=Immundisolibacter sp. TaxID=1934948 RepID=UPI003564FB6E
MRVICPWSCLPVSAVDVSDSRLCALTDWLGGRLDAFTLEPASADASFRRYFRVYHGPGSLIAMDAPPPAEDCRPFVHVAGLLRDAGLHAPQVLAADLERGFLLLSDLGRQTYLEVLAEDNAQALMTAAIDALVRWQQASRPDVLPPYDAALLGRELDLFPDWYVARHLGLAFTAAEAAAWQALRAQLIERALAQAPVFVHRDYMPRNLMPGEHGPGILDFQDAVYGPISYDVVSLLRDAFLSWPPAREQAWLERYWRQARAAGLGVPDSLAAFGEDCDLMGAQRHLKVLGIFARLNYRDGKPRYLAETPRFVGYIEAAAARTPLLAPLAQLLAGLHARAAA